MTISLPIGYNGIRAACATALCSILIFSGCAADDQGPMHTLNVEYDGSAAGRLTVYDGENTYTLEDLGTYRVPLGAELELAPDSPNGCFVEWSGDITGADAPGTLTVTGDHSVTATFHRKGEIEWETIGNGRITFDPPQPEGGYCPGTKVQVTAVPDKDWAFIEWMGGVLLNREWAPNQELTVRPGPAHIIVHFGHRPGLSGLDLKADLGAYLVATGVYTDPAQVDEFDYDTGGQDWQSATNSWEYVGNGIPDAAEFMALQHILETPSIEQNRGAISHKGLWQLYELNRKQVRIDLADEDAAIQRAVTAYWTVADWGHQAQIRIDGKKHFGSNLASGSYHNQGNQWFGADKDMDQDGRTNLEEWQAALAAAENKHDAAEVYAVAASSK